MKYPIFLLIVLVSLTSCQFFETEKISSETFYQEELKSIDWNDVDQYPVFSNCQENSRKSEQRNCFEKAISQQIHQSILKWNLKIMDPILDTISVSFSISKSADLKVTNVDMDSILDMRLPQLKNIIPASIDSLSVIAPAYKRGIPVNTTFTLPIVFKTAN